MRRIASLLFLIAVLALSLAIPPVAANAHCPGQQDRPAVSAKTHDHAAMHQHHDQSGEKKTDRKAADCLLRCLAACAGVTALGPSDHKILTLVDENLVIRPQLLRDGLPARPLLPPPQPAFI